jgi:pyruvate dehydrogenase E1 component alpha subunit
MHKQVNPFKAHSIEPPSTTVTTNKAELMNWFRHMYLMRRMEISSDMLYKASVKSSQPSTQATLHNT